MVALVMLAVAAGPARAQVSAVPVPGLTANEDAWGLATGPGNVAYVGAFDRLAMRSGHSALFDASGARDRAWPDVDGNVYAAVPDGVGGWFIGGEFSHVAGQPRAGLAHVGAGGELDPPWAPAVDAPDDGLDDTVAVDTLCLVGDSLYVGGYFTSIDGQARGGLAAVDALNGRLRPWNPRPNGGVHAIVSASGALYVGGAFSRVGSAVRRRLAAFDAATGALTAWNPGVTPYTTVGVNALVIDRGTLYAGGLFDAIAGQKRSNVAAFDLATGALNAWNPRSDFDVDALTVSGDSVFVGGEFSTVAGAERNSLAAVDARTGRVLPWRADVQGGSEANGETVFALTVVGDRLYVGGDFHSLAGQRRENLGAVSVAAGVPTGWDPRPSNAVHSLAAAGERVLAGGAFGGLDSQPFSAVAAIDVDTGALLPFQRPDIGAIATQGDSVYAGGVSRQRSWLRKLDARTGTAQRWDTRVQSPGELGPFAIAVRGTRVYAGGEFTRVGGHRRLRLAALDTRTGRVTPWRMDANGDVLGLTVHGHTLYVIGEFTRLGGHRRRHIAAIDLRTGRVTEWNPHLDSWGVEALAFDGGRVYLGGAFHKVRGHRRAHLAAVNASDGRLQPWHPRANGTVYALAVMAGTVYAGGDFTSISGTRRRNLAAFNGRSGALTAWNPEADSAVSALLATPAGLVATGDFTSVGGVSQQHLGIFLPTAEPPASKSNPPLR